MNIGIFDSGLGGLTIFKAIATLLPQYNYIYLGDNAHAPYGNRSPKIIYQFTLKAIEFLHQKNCGLTILACNTASAVALKKLQHQYLPQKYPQGKIIGVIKPTAEVVAENNFSRIAIIATLATVKSQSFVKEILKLKPQTEIKQLATPLLVPLIENNKINARETDIIIQNYLNQLLPWKPQCLILGCTHYGLIAHKINRQLKKRKISIISEETIIAEKLTQYLKTHPQLEKKLTKNHQRQFFVTDINNFYKRQVKLFFKADFKKKNHLELASYKL
jgi:glutamate racemase